MIPQYKITDPSRHQLYKVLLHASMAAERRKQKKARIINLENLRPSNPILQRLQFQMLVYYVHNKTHPAVMGMG